jgi:filamentous hemagglutinin family protein
MHKHASCNRFYRLVWSHVHACWVAIAEGARGRGKRAARPLSATLAGALAAGSALAAAPGLAGLAPPPANALPGGAQVLAGQARVTTDGNTMTVLQGSDKAILNWQNFDIGAAAAVRFVQPSAGAVALNRVMGADPSRIYGQLSANGQVFLINPSGVLFGAGARVDVGSLVASSLSLSDADFLAGRTTFSGTIQAGAVRNEGTIRSAQGGYVALLAPAVTNSGSIDAPKGSVALGAGERVNIDLGGDGLITLRVERGAVDALAANSGLLRADGGRVELTAQGRDALARASVNNTGLVQARGLLADGGSIRLAGDGDVHAGELDVSSAGGQGGQVRVGGHVVALDGAIDASGSDGGNIGVRADSLLSTAATSNAVGRAGAGGTISYRSGGAIVDSSSAAADASGARQGGSIALQGDGGVLSSASYSARSAAGAGGRIDVSGSAVRLLGATLDAGGASQGGAVRSEAPDLARFVTRWGASAPIANAGATFINDSTAIRVAAGGPQGQGGSAIVWSDRETTMLGSVDARGRLAAGTVEISSKDTLRHVGLERIALGAGGQLLLDPKNIVIGNSAGAWTYQAVLGKGYGGANGTSVAGLDQEDGFGFGVTLNAAGDRLAVGAPFDDGATNAGINRGAVYLFSFTDTQFSGAALQGTIGSGYSGGKNLNIALTDGAMFGSAVALNANATRLAVGSVGDGDGAVRLIGFGDGQFGAPTLTHTLGKGYGTPGLLNAGMFGSAVALNATGDRLAVGALGDTGNGSCGSCGAVYLFSNALTSPTFAKAIGAGHAVNLALPAEAQFGSSVAFDGSGDRLAVGASGVDGSRGAVYLFSNAYGATTHAATLGAGYSGGKNLNVPLAVYESFSSVALNSAGTRLAVGAFGAGNGNVRIIDFADDAFSAPAIRATLGTGNSEGAGAEAGLEAGEFFGFALALNGAGDRLVVGSPFSDGSLSDNGGYGTVRAFGLLAPPAGALGFGSGPGASATVDAAMLAGALDSGTAITLQANNDITLNAGNPVTVSDGSGNGALTLQAGRSIVLNANITTGNANLTLTANETAANGVVNAYRDSGAAVITSAAGTTIDAGSGSVRMTIADGAGKSNAASGSITLGGSLLAGSASLKNLGASANGNVVLGAAGAIRGTANGTIEIAAAGSGGGTFTNHAGAGGLDPGAGRYLVYSNNPGATLEGVSGYGKHYNQAYTGSTPAYAASGNWFLYSVAPVLNLSAAAANKVYDGGTALPALGYAVNGFIDGDSAAILSGSLGVSGLSKNAGTYAINAGSLGNALGYALNYTGASLTVSPRVLNATIGGVNKTYDGTTAASVTFGDDRIGGDQLSLTGSASFADKNAGSGKTVGVTGIVLAGADAGNYLLAASSATASADIARRMLTVEASGVHKFYDGTTAASVSLSDDRIAGDVLALSADASFVDKNVGSAKAIEVSGITLAGPDAANYTLAASTAATQAEIARRMLVIGAAGVDKVYDGSMEASVLLGDDRIAGDQLTLSSHAGFADRNVGAAKLVSVGDIVLGGVDADNYKLSSTSAVTTAAITPRTLSAAATGVNKTYDGMNAATVTFGDDRIAGDRLTLTGSARFADKNAGVGKTVNVSGIALSGVDAGNYLLAANSATTGADITPRPLTVSGMRAAAKVYDGSTLAAIADAGTLEGLVADERLQLQGPLSVAFATRGAGQNKLVTASGYRLADGANGLASNYTLAPNATSNDGVIEQATLTVKANDVRRPAGAANPAFGYTVSGLVGGDSPALLPEFTTATSATAASAAGNYAITVGSAATLADYRMAFLDGVLTVTAAAPGPAPTPAPLPEPATRPALPSEALVAAALQAPRSAQEPDPAASASLPAPRPDALVLTLAGGTEVLTIDGGIRTTEAPEQP